MKPEPKSIFTSQKDFGSQSAQEQVTPPQVPKLSTPAISPSPIPLEDAIDRETGLQDSIQEAVPRQESVATIRSREDSRELNIVGNHNTSINAPPQRQSSSPTTVECSVFRKPDKPPLYTPFLIAQSANAAKHPRSEDNGTRPVSAERAPKRNRPKVRPRHTLNPESFQGTIPRLRPGSPLSPLFFSQAKARHRPFLGASFSSSEAAATMLNKARDEPGGITTLKLARGSVSNASPPRSTSTPGSFASYERLSMPRSPDLRSKYSSGGEFLVNVGVLELLEQDERPSFIIDVADLTNFTPGPLQIVYANPSLRAYESILEMITGKADLDSPGIAVTNDFPEFKTWALSFVKNGESLDICLPSYLYGGITWTCTTLKRRLRLISGSGNAILVGIGSGSSNGALSSSSNFSERHRAPRGNYAKSPLVESLEASDYFGDAVVSTPTENSSPQPLVESPGLSDGTVAVPRQAILATQNEVLMSEMIRNKYSESSSFDWTRLPISDALPRHIKFARSIDWASTPLGPIETWKFDLRAMCNMIMGSPHPAAMYWGKEYTAIYNEAYVLLAGQKHPKLMVRLAPSLFTSGKT